MFRKPVTVAGVERGDWPMGDWSMRAKRENEDAPSRESQTGPAPLGSASFNAGIRQSMTRVDLPDPDGPDRQVSVPPRRMRSTFFRLWAWAPFKTRPEGDSRRGADEKDGICLEPESHGPVMDWGASMISKEVP